MAAPAYQFFTPEEYLAQERDSDHKNEYIDGQIIAMTGASRYHNRIVTNLTRVLDTQLLDRPYDVFGTDMRVKVQQGSMYTYPDLVVVCGEAIYEDPFVDTLVNPTVLVEVLSPSTENYDRGAKSRYYRRIPFLREYLLIAQNEPHVEHYVRDMDGWKLTEANELDQNIELPSIGCTLSLADIYRRVSFAPQEQAE